MSRMSQIQSWSDEKLVAELRSPYRAQLAAGTSGGVDSETYILLIAEALARLLARRSAGSKAE